MANWTKAQLKAITTKDKTLLISAAAGSGKTTVLIERIIRAISDSEAPMDILRMLIVTFTRAAASELKQRISVALNNALAEAPNEKLLKQLASLSSAHISTIDSFYGDVVRQYSERLGIPSKLRIADDTELTKIRKKIMNESIELGYSGELSVSKEEFALCADSLSDMRNDSNLFEIFLDLYNKLLGHPHSIEFLSECAEAYDKFEQEDLFSSSYGKVIKDYVKCELEGCVDFLTAAIDYFSGYDNAILAPFEDDFIFCDTALKMLDVESYTSVRDFFTTYSPINIKRPKGEDYTDQAAFFCDSRDRLSKDKIRLICKLYFGVGFSAPELKKYAKESSCRCRALYALLSEYNKRYSEEKLILGICEFSDIKLWAYELLVDKNGAPTDIAKSIADNFDCVFIDEYQDVDEIQDLIFRSISKPRGRFMVGDVKQSIYRFRGAEPSLFMNYRNTFAHIDNESDALPDNEDCTIFMSENFRCDKSVIQFANTVCSHLFKTASQSIDYKDEDDLSFSKPVNDGQSFSKVEVALIERKDAEVSFDNAEAAYIASEIDRLIREETKSDGSPIKATDIAVLSRGHSFGKNVARALERYGIKHSLNASANAFDDPQVSLVISLLNVIDNPMRDVYLAGVLMSPLFSFDADMLIKIKENADADICSLYDAVIQYTEREDEISKRCRSFAEELASIRIDVRSLPADKIIRYVFSRFSILSGCNKESYTNLIKLYENARSYEGDSFKGLYSYLKDLDEMMTNGISLSKDGEGTSDGVKITTIHKSKGLEFPVCFVSGCSISFNKDDAKDRLLYSSSLGIATDLVDETGFGTLRTPYRKALSRHILNESAEEEMRVLYVALTRARERLYVTGNPQYGAQRDLALAHAASCYGKRAGILNASNYMMWILITLDKLGDESDFFVKKVIPYKEIPELPNNDDKEPLVSYSNDEIDEELLKTIEDALEYEYPHLHISNIPAKLSVSKLSPDVLDINDEVYESTAVHTTLDVSLPDIYTPSFIDSDKKATAVAKGTATHTFLQFCDFDNAVKNGVRAELARLSDQKFIDPSTCELVNINQIEAFFASSLYKELKKAKKIYREQRFNVFLPASQFTEDKEYARLIESERLLVQGVIDIFFENESGELILCDYKTDHLSRAELNDAALAKAKLEGAHSRQLSYYAAALKEICGRCPDRVLIYSLPFGDSFEINV